MPGPTRTATAWDGSGAYPSLASNSTSKFIPQLWSNKLVEKFYAYTVFGEIASTDYEGEIKAYGDSVIIRTVPNLVINDYQVGQKLTYQTPESANVLLDINKAKYFAFQIDSIDKYQSDLNLMDKWAEDGGQQMKIAIDKDVLAGLYAKVSASNKGETAGAISGSVDLGTTFSAANGDSALTLTTGATSGKTVNILEFIVNMGLVLDEQNVPNTGRWLVLPAWACALIKTSDLKDASLAGDATSILRNGRIGMIDRFHIYNSNNVLPVVENGGTGAAVNLYEIIAGHKAGLTFAAQMTDMEDLPNPESFGKLIRGLNVFGWEMIEPKYCAGALVQR